MSRLTPVETVADAVPKMESDNESDDRGLLEKFWGWCEYQGHWYGRIAVAGLTVAATTYAFGQGAMVFPPESRPTFAIAAGLTAALMPEFAIKRPWMALSTLTTAAIVLKAGNDGAAAAAAAAEAARL